jgi:predicted PurR-regulated permease PerM
MFKDQQRIEQIAGLILIAAIVVGCLFVLRLFALAIIWAAILCFATWPLRELLLKWLKGRKNLAEGLMTVIILLVLFVPFLIMGLTFTDSINAGLKWLETHKDSALLPPPTWVERIPCVGGRITTYWANLAEDAEPALTRLRPWFQEAGLWLLKNSVYVAQGIFNLAMSVLIAFFLYRDGDGIIVNLREGFQRISGDYAQHLMNVVKTTVQSVVYGTIGTAIAQGVASWYRVCYSGSAFADDFRAVYFFSEFCSDGTDGCLAYRVSMSFCGGSYGMGYFYGCLRYCVHKRD